MTQKIWRGDAPAVAQVSTATPANVEIGDAFALTINTKAVTFVATAATPNNVCDGLAAAINGSTLPEFGEITASSANGVLTLTANDPGVPFVATAGAADGGSILVVVTTTAQGVTPVSAIQVFSIPVSANGYFTVTFGDQTTSGQAIGASAATIQTALQGLSTIGSGNVSVAKSTDSNDDIYTCTFQGALAATPVAVLIPRILGDATTYKPLIRTIQEGSTSGTVRNEIQTVDLGTFGSASAGAGITYTLTVAGQTTAAVNVADAATVLQTALELLSNVDTVTVSRLLNVLTVEFTGIDGSANQSKMTASSAVSGTNCYWSPVVTVTASGAGNSEVQVVSFSSPPTGGTFTLTFGANTTSGLAYNAAAATVQTALQGLASIGSGNATVSGSAGGPWTVTFAGTLANANQPSITGDGSSLTHSTTEDLVLAAVTASTGPHHWDEAANWLPAGVPVNSDAVIFESNSSDCLYGLAQSGVTLTSLHIAATYTGKLGLPRNNASGYLEFRPSELSIGATTILIGHGEGSGSGKIAINTGSVQTAIEVRSSGGSSDVGVPAITWRGTNANSDVEVLGGDFGTAPYSDQTAVIRNLVQRGGTVSLKHTALTSIEATGQRISAYDCTLGSASLAL